MKKYSQSDLRRLMNEKKQQTAQPTTTKINSPLAKYPFKKQKQTQQNSLKN